MKNIALILFTLWIGIAFAKPEFVTVKGGPMSVDTYVSNEMENATIIQVPSFQMAKYEVTVGDFKQFVKETKYQTTAQLVGKSFGKSGTGWDYNEGQSWIEPGYEQMDSHPVSSLSWYDAISYCNWRSKKDGLKAAYTIDKKKQDPNNENPEDPYKWTVTWNKKANGYRLPTEVEWEFAARNRGANQNYVWGIDTDPLFEEKPVANLSYYAASYDEYDDYDDYDDYEYYDDYDDDDDYVAKQPTEDGFEFTAPVGSFAPNPLGIYDLAGNISELCWDWYEVGKYYNITQESIDGPEKGLLHAHRGSAWCDEESEWPVTFRRDCNTDYLSYQYFGMRLVKNAKK